MKKIRDCGMYSVRRENNTNKYYEVDYTDDIKWISYKGAMKSEYLNGIGKLSDKHGNYKLGLFINNIFVKGVYKHKNVTVTGVFTKSASKYTCSLEEQDILFEGITGKISQKEGDEFATIILPTAEVKCTLYLCGSKVNISDISSILFKNGCSITDRSTFKVNNCCFLKLLGNITVGEN